MSSSTPGVVLGEMPAEPGLGALPALVVVVSVFKDCFLLLRLVCSIRSACRFLFYPSVKDFSTEMDECCCSNFGLQHPFPEKGAVKALKLDSLRHHTCLGSLMYQTEFTAKLKKSVSY